MASTLPATDKNNTQTRDARRAPWHAFLPLWLMCAPAFLLFATLVLVPLVMTLVLTFYRFDPASGPLAAFQFGNYAEVLGSSYFLKRGAIFDRLAARYLSASRIFT